MEYAGVDLNMIDLRVAFDKLGKEAQALLVLRYFRGKTQKETAALLGKSQAQISRMENLTLDQLRELLS